VGLTVGLLYAVRAAHRPATVRRAVLTLLVVEVAQGTIGFVQYFTDLPVVLVGFHLLGAALVSATATWMLLVVRETPLQTARTTAGPHPRGQALPSSSP
jgi:cytochrome c oxidase assembly protein subunit 15